MAASLVREIKPEIIRCGYDREYCWVQTRAGLIPPHTVIMTTQKLRLTGSDIFYCIHSLRSDDDGKSWGELTPQPGLDRRPDGSGLEFCPCDGTPAWHAATGKLLLTGHTACYRDDELVGGNHPRTTFYSIYDPERDTWSPMCDLELPDPDGAFHNYGAGCTQRVDLPNGDILLPHYGRSREDETGRNKSAVMRCAFDGERLTFIEQGEPLGLDVARGACEPSLALSGGEFFLTIRNDEKGYVARSSDGMNFSEPVPWTFEDGSEIGNYNTQQHWVNHSDGLFLVYTRRGYNNDHVFRHRAPLLMAQVDTQRLCLIRDTEQVVVPERGARLGNFGVVTVSADESWVVVSEWMQTNGPDYSDSTVCEKYGSDNAFFLSRIKWEKPNLLAPQPA